MNDRVSKKSNDLSSLTKRFQKIERRVLENDRKISSRIDKLEK